MDNSQRNKMNFYCIIQWTIQALQTMWMIGLVYQYLRVLNCPQQDNNHNILYKHIYIIQFQMVITNIRRDHRMQRCMTRHSRINPIKAGNHSQLSAQSKCIPQIRVYRPWDLPMKI